MNRVHNTALKIRSSLRECIQKLRRTLSHKSKQRWWIYRPAFHAFPAFVKSMGSAHLTMYLKKLTQLVTRIIPCKKHAINHDGHYVILTWQLRHSHILYREDEAVFIFSGHVDDTINMLLKVSFLYVDLHCLNTWTTEYYSWDPSCRCYKFE